MRTYLIILGFCFFLSLAPISKAIVYENEYGRLEVTPDTASSPLSTQEQQAKLTWKYPSMDIDVAFRFDFELSNAKIWKLVNNSYYKEEPLYEWNEEQGPNGTIMVREQVGTEQVYVEKFDWVLITTNFEHQLYNNKHYYYVKDFYVQQDKDYFFKWQYDVPRNTSGKWDLLAKRSVDTIEEALSTGRYIMLDPWWNSSFTYYSTIRIESDYVETALTNFPVQVKINTTVGALCDSGNSIRFVSTDNTTVYYHEIENWSTTEDSIVWVNVTSISDVIDTIFLMYYNNSAAVDSSDRVNVWNSYYQAVYHMNDSSDNQHIDDSTSGLHHGTKLAADNPNQQAGQIAYDQYWDGGDGINTGNWNFDDGTDPLTFQLWMKPTNADTPENQIIVDKFQVAPTVTGIFFLFTAATGCPAITMYDVDTKGLQVRPNTAPPDGSWTWVTATYDGSLDPSGFAYYYGLTKQAQSTETDNNPGSNMATGSDVHIGSRSSALYYTGEYDELRILNKVVSQQESNTTFHSVNYTTGFITWGQPQTEPPAPTPSAYNFSTSSPYYVNGSYYCPCCDAINITVTLNTGNNINLTWYRSLDNSSFFIFNRMINKTVNATYGVCVDSVQINYTTYNVNFNETWYWYVNISVLNNNSATTQTATYYFNTYNDTSECYDVWNPLVVSDETWLIGLIVLFSLVGPIIWRRR